MKCLCKYLHNYSRILFTSMILISSYLNYSTCTSSEHIEISAIKILGYAPRGPIIQGQIECADTSDSEGSIQYDCNLDPRKGEGISEELMIQDHVLEISSETARKYRIVLKCNATCPAHWRFYPAKEQLTQIFQSIDVKPRRETQFDRMHKIKSLTYFVNLTLQGSSNELTGKYICQCSQFSEVTDYVYLLLEEPERPLLVNAESDQEMMYFIYPRPGSDLWFDLPCGLSKRGPLYLFAHDSTALTYTEIFPNASIIHDPLAGITLKGRELPSVYDKFWICTTTRNLSEIQIGIGSVVSIIFSKKRDPITNEFSKPHSFVTEDSTMACCRLTCARCSVEGIRPPSMAAYSVKNSITAALFNPLLSKDSRRLLGATMLASYCLPTRVLGQNNSVPEFLELDESEYTLKCYQNSVSKRDLEIVFSPCSFLRLQDNVQTGFIFVCDNNNYQASKFDRHSQLTSSDEYSAPLSGNRRVRFNSNNTISLRNTTTMRLRIHAQNMYREIYFSKTERALTVELTKWFYFENKTEIPTSYSESQVPSDSDFNEEELIRISQIVAAEGESRCYICEASRYHFAGGLIWSIQWTNGSLIYYFDENEGVEREHDDDTMKYFDEDKDTPPRITSRFCPTLRFGMENITCYAPMWNTPDWKALSVNMLRILKAEPTTIEPENDSLTNQEIFKQIPIKMSCKFYTKSPLIVEWYINDWIVQEMHEPTPSCLLSECKPIVSNCTLNLLHYRMLFEPASAINITCLGRNSLGFVSQSFWLHVIQNTVPRILNPETEYHEFQYGEVHKQLNCSAVGFPKPNRIEWYKLGGSNIQHNAFLEANDDDKHITTSILNIPEISMDSAGSYSCKASNEFGEIAVKNFEITVKKPLTIQLVIGGSVTFVILLAGIFVFLLIKFRRQNMELKKLEHQFRKGFKPSSEDDKTRVRHLALPWTGLHEIDEALWTKHHKLDAGCFGEIWFAELRNMDFSKPQQIVIKCLSSRGRTLDNLKVLCSELKMMMLVQELGSHPNVVTFLGASTKYFQRMDVNILMEYCQNGSIKKYIKDHKNDLFRKLDANKETASPQLDTWAYQIASGMKFLSDHGILHIDLAARNILLTRNLVAKVADLGLSRNLYGRETYHRKEVDLPKLWTAPEALSENIITVKSDVWSYGITLWEMYSKGSSPTYGSEEVVEEIRKGNRLPKPESATEETYKLMQDCWEWKPSQRPDFDRIIAYFERLSEQEIIDTNSDQITAQIETEEEYRIPSVETFVRNTNTGTDDVGEIAISIQIELNTFTPDYVQNPLDVG